MVKESLDLRLYYRERRLRRGAPDPEKSKIVEEGIELKRHGIMAAGAYL